MTQSDPFAEVAMDGSATKAPARPDAFTDSASVDDPFATSSDLGGGDYTPAAPLETLDGRVVVMIPRKFDPTASDPNDPSGQKTRELYTVDLTVLSGGELRYSYNVKADAEHRREAGIEEMVIEDVSPEHPFSITGYWVPQNALVGKLKKCHAVGRPYLGVVAMVPVRADRDKGKTAAQVRAEVKAWDDRGRKTARPRYAWVLEDPTPEQKAIAVSWWMANRDRIAPIVPAPVS
jgi:hypothetical protein